MALVNTKQSSKHKIARHLFTLFFAIYSFSALALQPTPEQLEQFKLMSPAEQSRIAKQFGIDASQFDGGGATMPDVVQETTVLSRDLLQEKKMAELDEALNADAKGNEEPLKLSELKPFGYDLFAGTPTTYTPITDVPVSSDYVLGPGDSLKMAKKRLSIMKRAKNSRYQQIITANMANYNETESPTSRRIRGWLMKNAGGTLVKVKP